LKTAVHKERVGKKQRGPKSPERENGSGVKTGGREGKWRHP